MDDIIKTTLEVEVQVPRLPNFIIAIDGTSIPVQKFSDADLLEIAQRWTEMLIEKARHDRKHRPIEGWEPRGS